MKKALRILTALFPLLLSAPHALAHALYVFAQYDGQTVTGKSYYSDMTPAAETYVEVLRHGENQPLMTGKTDSRGYFHFPLVVEPKVALKVVVEGEEGHRAAVVADRITATPNTPTQASDESLLLLRGDIAQLRDKISLHDILGGIGYIVGIAGIAAWLSARKLRKGR